jgi:hypothetical protein
MKQVNWVLKQEFVDYLKKVKEDHKVLEVRLDSKENPKNIEIILLDEEDTNTTR